MNAQVILRKNVIKMEEKEMTLDNAASGVEESGNVAEQQQEQAETARQKALKRTRGRNASRSFADDDDEALFGAMNEDSEYDEQEMGRLRQRESDMDEFLRQNPRGASLLASMRRDGNPVGQLVEDYGEDMVASLSDPEVRKSVVEAEKRRLERIAKEKEFEEEATANLEKSKAARQELIDEGYDEAEVDNAIKEIIDRAVRNLMSDISREDIEGVLNLNNRESDMAEAENRGEIRGRNANIANEMNKRKRQSDGLPSMGNNSGRQVKKEEEDSGALGALANRKSMW